MTITNTDRVVVGTGNGATTVWPHSFKIPDAASANVEVTEIATGIVTVIDAADYTITGLGEGSGTVTYPKSGTPLADTHTITRYREVPATQTINITNQTKYYANVVMAVWDRIVMMVQDLTETIGRQLSFPIGEITDGTLPTLSERASKFLGFNASGEPIAATTITTSVVSSFMETVLDDITAAQGRTTLGIDPFYDTVDALILSSQASVALDTMWFGGIFRFSEAASGASDPHITTAGGVKLYEAGPYSTRDRLKRHNITNIGDGYSLLAEGSSWQWDSMIPIDTHQADTGELKYVAPNAAAIGAWVLDFTKEPLSAFDQIKMRMAVGRVDFIGIGDSNQLHSGFGWDHGLQYALDQKFEMYATGLISINEGNASGAGTGYQYNFNASQALLGAVSGAPAALDDYLDKGAGGLGPHFYGYLAAGSVGAGANSGMVLEAAPEVLDNTAILDFELHYGTFAAGAGDFEGSVRLNASPFSQLVTTGVISTNTGSETIQRVKMSIAADTGRAGKALGARWVSNANGINSPFFGLWQRASNPARLTGYSFHTLDYRGGESKRTMAVDMQQLSDTAMTYYFSEARRLQGLVKTIVITINSGANDRNETLTSVGPNAVTDGDSAGAFVDNFEAIKIRIEEIWTNEGWDMSELYWLVYPTHPVSDPDDEELISYRDAVSAHILDIPNAQMIDISLLTNETEMLANSWYASAGADRNHLTQSGYEQIGIKILDDMS